jgi:hypothetical protein
MSFSVIDNDKEQLHANRISGQSRVTSNTLAIRARRDAKGLTEPRAKALKPILEFAHASEDPRETPNDG